MGVKSGRVIPVVVVVWRFPGYLALAYFSFYIIRRIASRFTLPWFPLCKRVPPESGLATMCPPGVGQLGCGEAFILPGRTVGPASWVPAQRPYRGGWVPDVPPRSSVGPVTQFVTITYKGAAGAPTLSAPGRWSSPTGERWLPLLSFFCVVGGTSSSAPRSA